MPRDAERLLDMLVAARIVRAKLEGFTRERFDEDDDRQIVILHFIQIIGEAAARVSSDTHAAHPAIAWRTIVGMRNRLVHDYLNVNVDILWDVATIDIPHLMALLEQIVEPEAE